MTEGTSGVGKPIRTGYNPETDRFQPLKKADPKKLESLNKAIKKAHNVAKKAPFYQNFADALVKKNKQLPELDFAVKDLGAPTKGVKEFFKGDSRKFGELTNSLRAALKKL